MQLAGEGDKGRAIHIEGDAAELILSELGKFFLNGHEDLPF